EGAICGSQVRPACLWRLRGNTEVMRLLPRKALKSRAMDIQTITKKYAYKIEPKPEGGFIARATDPTVPPIEGATREEVQRRIRETVFSGLSQAFPGFKIPLQTKNAKLEFHIDRKPEGGFAVHSTEVGSPTMTPATHEKVDHLTEQLFGFI